MKFENYRMKRRLSDSTAFSIEIYYVNHDDNMLEGLLVDNELEISDKSIRKF